MTKFENLYFAKRDRAGGKDSRRSGGDWQKMGRELGGEGNGGG